MQSTESTKRSAGIGPFGYLCKAPLIHGGFLMQSSSEHANKVYISYTVPSFFSGDAQPYYCGPLNAPNVMAVATHG